MGMTNLTPGDGEWDIRLSCTEPTTGQNTVALYNPKVWTQAGPLPLRFPSSTYALRWLDSLTIEGSRNPSDDDEVSRDLTSSFVSAKGNSTTWGPIVNVLASMSARGSAQLTPQRGTRPGIHHEPVLHRRSEGSITPWPRISSGFQR
jgi:hypothetical protein